MSVEQRPRDEVAAPVPSAAANDAAAPPAPDLGVIPQGWTPTGTVAGHSGAAIPGECVFPVPPPAEIGTIRSAFSTIRTHTPAGQKLWKRVKGLGSGVLYGLVLGNVLCYIGVKLGLLPRLGGPEYTYGLGFCALVGGALGLVGAGPKATVTYVGELGTASYGLDGRTYGIKKAEVFRFATASYLKTSQTRSYTNGVYTGTSYNYQWDDSQRKQVYQLIGGYHHAKGNPPADSPFWFAHAAEAAYTEAMLAQARAALAQGAAIQFPLNGQNYVQIDPAAVELRVGGKSDRMTLEEVGAINIEQGQVMIARKGAKAGVLGIGASGVFKFAYGELCNAKLLFTLLGKAFEVGDLAGGINPAPAMALAQTANRASKQAAALREEERSSGDSRTG